MGDVTDVCERLSLSHHMFDVVLEGSVLSTLVSEDIEKWRDS